MYHPLGVNFSKTWNAPRIQPDERVASSATEEARKIKRDIARRHLLALCYHEEKLFTMVDRDAIQDIYSQLGLEMPMPLPALSQAEEEEDSNCIGSFRENDVDYETVLLARSRFHPDKKARDLAVAGLLPVEKQEMEDWNALDGKSTVVDCNIMGTDEMSTITDENPDTALGWLGSEEQQTQWQDNDVSEDDAESQQSVAFEEDPATDDEFTGACVAYEQHLGLPTPPASELPSVPSPPTHFKHDASSEAGCSSSDGEFGKADFCATEELTTVLNDKKALTIYLDSIDEGIRRARRTAAEKEADRERTHQLYCRPRQRPMNGRGQFAEWEWSQGLEPAEGQPLHWFDYEKMHLYDESSGKWKLTVERRGRNYMLARASDPEILDQTKKRPETSTSGNPNWSLDTVPAWASGTCSDWFDKE